MEFLLSRIPKRTSIRNESVWVQIGIGAVATSLIGVAWWHRSRKSDSARSDPTPLERIPDILLESPYANELKLAVELALKGEKQDMDSCLEDNNQSGR